MIVASLSPTRVPEDSRFPSMTNFTNSAMEIIEETAREDIGRDARIGRLDSWGRPSFVDKRLVLPTRS